MILLQSLVFLLTSLSFAQPLEITTLGARPSECGLRADEKVLVIADEFKAQAQQKFANDNLKSAVVAGDPCFRVGTEVSLELSSGEIRLLGNAFISKVQKMEAHELLNNVNFQNYSKASLKQYFENNKGQKINIIYYKVIQKITNTALDQKYDRLPSCFVSNADWRSYGLDDEKWKDELEELKTGVKKADIWNGTNNCFKVGVSVEITAKDVKEKLGLLIPTKVYLTHYTEITQEQANILGEKLEDLKKRLAENKDKYGGYTTMAVYDYLAPTTTQQ